MEGARLSEDPLLTSIKLSEALTDTGDDEKEEGRKGKVIFRSVIRDNNQLPERLSLFGALSLLNSTAFLEISYIKGTTQLFAKLQILIT